MGVGARGRGPHWPVFTVNTCLTNSKWKGMLPRRPSCLYLTYNVSRDWLVHPPTLCVQTWQKGAEGEIHLSIFIYIIYLFINSHSNSFHLILQLDEKCGHQVFNLLQLGVVNFLIYVFSISIFKVGNKDPIRRGCIT